MNINKSKINNNVENDSDDNHSEINIDDDINDIKNKEDENDLIKTMKINYSYPNQNDQEFQNKIYRKREFYYNKIPHRNIIIDYDDIKKFRDNSCGGNFSLRSQQSLLANFINPNTPFKGILIYHGLGTGKTCSAIAIAETFKYQVMKYNTKIHVLVPGPLLKESWKDELIKCTKETYLKEVAQNVGYINDNEKNKAIKQAKLHALQYYKIISYRSFYKKVLGQKISDKNNQMSDGKKLKKIFKKNLKGEYERDISIDKITSLDNTLLIIDEAHNVTDNEYGNAIKKIIENSKNLKIILLTATPMINFANEIIELINYIRPIDDPVIKEKIFTSDKMNIMSFKEGGLDYLKKMMNGYVSHFRGTNPLTFADGIDEGEIPDELLFTHIVRCPMHDFQLNAYNNITKEIDDSLDRRSQAVANFCFPTLSNDKTNIIGDYGKKGIENLRNQIKLDNLLLSQKINEKFFNNNYKDPLNIIKNTEKNISGLILKDDNIKNFSAKFHAALLNINDLIIGKKGPGTAFVYFNLVKVGIELFAETLIQNGYLEYNPNNQYNITNNTIDAITGLTNEEFKKMHNKSNIKFYPATFIIMTGKSDDSDDQLPDIKKKLLDSVFSNFDNRDGKFIKIVLGSKVMNEGITLENVKEVHVLDVYYNLGKLQQVIGRALRECKHYKLISNENKYPKVNIYRYVISFPQNYGGIKTLTTEEEMYKKAESKYILIKEVERALKEVAFDCPLNYHGNIFPEETLKYKNCVSAKDLQNMTVEERKKIQICPIQCDLQKCEFKCFDKKLNLEYYDSNSKLYKKISKNKIDFSTFTGTLARNEIEYAKEKIKDLFKFRYVYLLDELVNKIKKSYIGEKRDLFEIFFVYRALDELIPIAENDFNNFQDTVYDKYNVPGYVIYRSKYYIFQPYEQNEDVPMYYRSTYDNELFNELSLYNYLKTTNILDIIKKNNNVQKIIGSINNQEKNDSKSSKITYDNYDFNSTLEYYDNRDEFDIVGIIDKASIAKRSINEIIPDVFKIRNKREKILDKKRGTGIPSLKGAVCDTSKNKEELLDIMKILKIKNVDENSRSNVCKYIRDRLLLLEKYSLNENKNKLTYIIIPSNHPNYKFPLNIEDRIINIQKKTQNKIPFNIKFNTNKLSYGIFEGIKDASLFSFELFFEDNPDFLPYVDFIISNNFIKKKNKEKNIWFQLVD